MKRQGFHIKVTPEAITWHYRQPSGGIRRADATIDWWNHDEVIFRDLMKQWGVHPREVKLIVLNNGLGDHIVFKSILPEIKEKFKEHRIVISNCYPQVFEDQGLEMISIAEAGLLGDVEKYNVYGWMTQNNWQKDIREAFRSMYL